MNQHSSDVERVVFGAEDGAPLKSFRKFFWTLFRIERLRLVQTLFSSVLRRLFSPFRFVPLKPSVPSSFIVLVVAGRLSP